MARKVHVYMTDDLDGEIPADETVSFSLDGTAYEIDLSAENARELREGLARFVAAARTVGKAARGKGSTGGKRQGPAPADVRAWARENGHEVPDRGRIPAELVDAYREAHAA